MRTCPGCAEEIQDNAAVCRYCGRESPPRGLTVPRVIAGLIIFACVILFGAFVS